MKRLSEKISKLGVDGLGENCRILNQRIIHELERGGDADRNVVGTRYLALSRPDFPRPKKLAARRWFNEVSERSLSAIVCIIADFPLPNGPLSHITFMGGLESFREYVEHTSVGDHDRKRHDQRKVRLPDAE